MIRNVIFGFGSVLFEWNPRKIVQTFTDSISEQNLLFCEVLSHSDWLEIDRGTMLLAEEIPKFSARTGIDSQRIEDFILHIQQNLTKIPETETLFYSLLEKDFSLYYLTNMCSAFFETLCEEHQFISQFDGGIVSGKELVIKPELEIYHLLCQRYKLNPADSLFIDKNLMNVHVAKSLGFNTVLFTPTQSCFQEIENILYNNNSQK